MKNLFTSFFVLCLGLTNSIAQEKYAVLIAGEYDPDNIQFPSTEQWNNGNLQGSEVFDEFWNDTYLMWEMLIKPEVQGGKDYSDQNVHVLFANNEDYIFPEQDDRYTAGYNGYLKVTDGMANQTSIESKLASLANTITENDFLFVWVMSHGGTDAQGSYFYSYDAQKVYDTQLAAWLNGINAFKKTIFLSFPSSGGFTNELEGERTIIITSSQINQGSSRADNQAPDGFFTENETLGTNIYNHGEFNYHLFSSLSGETPFGQTTYGNNNIPLYSADLNLDNFISLVNRKHG